ncbi:hypothetical protein D3C84_635690 [compost metagenome]
MQDVLAADLLFEMGVDHVQQVIGFAIGNCHFRRIAGVLAVGGADQGEVIQVRNGEHDALIFVLQDVRVFAFVQFRHDQVAALDQADAVRRFHLQVVANELGDPWAGSVHQRLGADREQAAVGSLQVQVPQAFATTGTDATGLGVDVGTFFAGGHGVEYHEAGVVDPAVGVFEALGDFAFQCAVGAEFQASGAGEFLALAQVVIQEQAGTDHPRRTQVRAVRQHEAHLLDDVRRLGQQYFPFCQSLAHQAEFVMFEVAQATVDQLAAGRRGMAGQIVLFAKEHRETAAGGIRCNPDTVDPATDNGNVIDLGKWGRQGRSGHRLASGSMIFCIGIRT